MTALHLASLFGLIDIMRLLIDNIWNSSSSSMLFKKCYTNKIPSQTALTSLIICKLNRNYERKWIKQNILLKNKEGNTKI